MNYVYSKIEHMRRAGLITGGQKNNGLGKHGGACPDWLKSEQKGERAESIFEYGEEMVVRDGTGKIVERWTITNPKFRSASIVGYRRTEHL